MAAPRVTALVSGAGSMPGVAVINALRQQEEIPLRVVAADCNPLSAGFALAAAHHTVPRVDDPEFIPAMLEICRFERVDLVFPIIDEEQLIFAEQRERFAAAGVRIVANDPEAIRRVRDKFTTVRFAQAKGIRVPETYLPGDVPPAGPASFPLVVKPRDGRGTMMVFTARTIRELEFFTGYVPNPMIQRLITGQEYTIDVLMDFGGTVISVVPKARLETKAGMQVKGRIAKDAALIDYGRSVATAFGMAPRCNVQCIMADDGPYLIEVNPKFSASLPFTVAAGVNFPLLLVKMHLGEHVAPMMNGFADGLVMLRYWQEVYL